MNPITIKSKYPDKEELESIVKESYSYSEVLRKIGRKVTGSNHSHLKNKLVKMEISTKHFNSNFNIFSVKNKPKPIEEVFVVLPEGSRRPRREQLLRSLLAIGVKYLCGVCGMEPIWQGKTIILEVDHIDGNFLNNLQENLRFICPNCHSQQKTSYKNKTNYSK